MIKIVGLNVENSEGGISLEVVGERRDARRRGGEVARWRGSIIGRLEVFPRNQRLLESGVYEFTVVM